MFSGRETQKKIPKKGMDYQILDTEENSSPSPSEPNNAHSQWPRPSTHFTPAHNCPERAKLRHPHQAEFWPPACLLPGVGRHRGVAVAVAATRGGAGGALVGQRWGRAADGGLGSAAADGLGNGACGLSV